MGDVGALFLLRHHHHTTSSLYYLRLCITIRRSVFNFVTNDK